MPLSMLIPFRRGRHAIPVSREPAPFGSVFGDVDRLVDDFWRGFGVGPAVVEEGGFAPRIDVSETDHEYRVTAELPGLEEKDFDVALDGDILTLKGEKRASSEEEKDGYRHVERVHGRFERSLRIAGDFDAAKVKAAYKHGVLTVTLPKSAQAQERSRAIPVTTG